MKLARHHGMDWSMLLSRYHLDSSWGSPEAVEVGGCDPRIGLYLPGRFIEERVSECGGSIVVP